MAFASLPPHIKAHVDLTNIERRLSTLRTKMEDWQGHPDVREAHNNLGAAVSALATCLRHLSALPQTYQAHASKIAVKNIEIGALVSIRPHKRKQYAPLVPEAEMTTLKVVELGNGNVTLELASGVRILARRGDIATE